MIRLMIVDDSPTETLVLRRIFESEGDIEVVACAKNGIEAVRLTEKLHPDVITMDIMMPLLDGIEAIKHIMTSCPTPIVVISSKLDDAALNASYRALEAGALAVLDKPVNVASLDANPQLKELISTVRAMADIKVVKRRFLIKTPIIENVSSGSTHRSFDLVAIGASAGGPQALKMILSSLPSDFPLPILVVQHMTTGFMQGFVEWLNKETTLNIKLAKDREELMPGCVYFAPDDYHMEVQRPNGKLFAKLSHADPCHGFRPSVSVLFNSVAATLGEHSLAVLLTGMGQDGADGMLAVKQASGHTIVQDQQSAVVFGMPGIALSLNAVDKVVTLDQIPSYLVSMAKHRS